MRSVHVKPRGMLRRGITVEVGSDGEVRLDGEKIGRVEKSHRTYGPPIHRGSPIARYHKRVPCWRIESTRLTFDTRADAIAYLAARDSD